MWNKFYWNIVKIHFWGIIFYPVWNICFTYNVKILQQQQKTMQNSSFKYRLHYCNHTQLSFNLLCNKLTHDCSKIYRVKVDDYSTTTCVVKYDFRVDDYSTTTRVVKYDFRVDDYSTTTRAFRISNIKHK
jgi:hypothetical protein